MAVLIEGMEMPKNCEACEIAKHFDGYQENDCPFNAFSYYDCPLIPVPPHGRLIDANALMGRIEHDTPLSSTFEKIVRRYIENAPTVIPASEEGET